MCIYHSALHVLVTSFVLEGLPWRSNPCSCLRALVHNYECSKGRQYATYCTSDPRCSYWRFTIYLALGSTCGMGTPGSPLACFFTFNHVHGMHWSSTSVCLNHTLCMFIFFFVTFNAYLFTCFSYIRKEDNQLKGADQCEYHGLIHMITRETNVLFIVVLL
jgi:ABC-type Fe3+ transport system permease subunit